MNVDGCSILSETSSLLFADYPAKNKVFDFWAVTRSEIPMYDPKVIANYFIDLAIGQNRPLTPMKLQKLVYFAHGWNLAIKDLPLIGEQIEAWTYGPVIPSLYHDLKHYGNLAISFPTTHRRTVINESEEDIRAESYIPRIGTTSPEDLFTRSLLGKIWEKYGRYSAIQLSNATHNPGTPWHRVYSDYAGQVPKRTDIPQAYIKEYFKRIGRPGSGQS